MRPWLIPTGVACVLLAVALAVPAQGEVRENEVRVASRTEVFYYEVDGPGKANSFYETGSHILQELDIWSKNPVGEKWYSTIDFTGRATDHEQFDTETWSVEMFQWKMEHPRFEFGAGDVFANFSQYSMNKAIKGGYAQVNIEEDRQSYFRIAYGSFDSQWEYLYNHDDNEPVDRYGGGFRLQGAGAAGPFELMGGVNLAHVDDRDDDPQRTFESTHWNTVGSVDWEARLQSLVVAGEHAYSSDTEYRTDGTENDTTGSANKISLRAAAYDTRLNYRWERVSTDFLTLGGGASPDRDRHYMKADHKVTRTFFVFGIGNHTRNNLSDDLANTRRITTGELGLRYRRAFGRNSLTLSVSGRRKWVDNTDDQNERITDRVKFLADDRFFRILRVRGNFEAILEDNLNAPGSPESYFYGIELSSRHRLMDGKLEIRPSLSLERQERDAFVNEANDVADTYRAELFAVYDRYLRAGGTVERYHNNYDDPAANDALRDKQMLYLEYQPQFYKEGTLRLEGSNTDYIFDDKTQGYNEKIAKLTLRIGYDRKWGE
ncbi:MAG: hypothetical protein ACLFOY_16360 [Desulfatibacillaceae bacterium]